MHSGIAVKDMSDAVSDLALKKGVLEVELHDSGWIENHGFCFKQNHDSE